MSALNGENGFPNEVQMRQRSGSVSSYSNKVKVVLGGKNLATFSFCANFQCRKKIPGQRD